MDSEGIEIVDKVLLDLVEVIERVKYVVLKDCMEFVLNACYNCCHLQRVDALIIEALSKVKCFEIVDGKLIENPHHSSDNLTLVHAVSSHLQVLLGKLVI